MNSVPHNLDINYASDLNLIQSMYEDDSYWDHILDAKLDYLNNDVDPRTSGVVRDEVADSWVISKAKGLRPDSPVLGEYVTSGFVEESLERNAQLVEETRTRIRAIESLNMDNDFIFELMDTNGLSLVQIGDLKLHQFVGEKYLVSERNAGTNAHSLCMRHKKPFAIIGPEHYCFALHSLIACAAPIIDQFDNAIGALLLTQPILDYFTTADKKVLVHAMSLISSLASSISASLCIAAYNEEITTVESQLSRARHEAQLYEGLSRDLMSTADEGTLVLDDQLIVQHANPEAGHIFKTIPEELLGKHACELFDLTGESDPERALKSSKQMHATIKGEKYDIRSNPTYIVSDSTEPSGFVLLVKHAKLAGTRKNKGAGDAATVTFEGILGSSPTIERAKSLARRFARTSENILITGESGTGKELFAQAIHNVACPGGPFMALNCAAIPPRLIESELFGYESGSFTGADKQGRPGKIELADGGTLFLDEIGDMPLELQTTLLRVLENKRVMRVGGKSYKQVSFRLVSATNRNLNEVSLEGKFRADLLYRLSVLSVELPPLRERAGDALFFANYYLNECQAKTSSGPARLSSQAETFISSYEWPGNVRQLKHAIYSAYYTSENGIIALDDFPAYIVQGACGKPCPVLSQNESYSPVNVQPQVDDFGIRIPQATEPATLPTLSLDELETLAITEALKRANGNVTDAAAILGVSKATLYRKLKK